MKTMRLRGGDLMIGTSADYQMVTGAPKVQQDVRNALLEPLGNDRFHPGWGSGLADHVGLTFTDFRQVAVLGEVNRVVGNYAAVQRDRVEYDMHSGGNTRFNTDEILAAVSDVSVRGDLDVLSVRITISTAAGSAVVVEEALT